MPKKTLIALLIVFNVFLHSGYAELLQCFSLEQHPCDYPWAIIRYIGDIIEPINRIVVNVISVDEPFIFSSALTYFTMNILFLSACLIFYQGFQRIRGSFSSK